MPALARLPLLAVLVGLCFAASTILHSHNLTRDLHHTREVDAEAGSSPGGVQEAGGSSD
eukprot:CAMPEP_0182887134 /NCGR_PEP_ID=MMETSP0034_2-20130328/20641_1 /TAXON_ID=156128 /ORGANISM="Nephroselmis pyriformis, Strain CCMP717" /LENGTH=58 /DNA_ID=CAMNT_0025020487 /DNA_START=299 /DNA_END=472 /DNA_ORIENTATION=+